MSDPVRNPASVTIVTMILAMSPTDDFRSIDMGFSVDVVTYMPGPLSGQSFLIETRLPSSRIDVTLVDVTSSLVIVPDYAVGREAVKS